MDNSSNRAEFTYRGIFKARPTITMCSPLLVWWITSVVCCVLRPLLSILLQLLIYPIPGNCAVLSLSLFKSLTQNRLPIISSHNASVYRAPGEVIGRILSLLLRRCSLHSGFINVPLCRIYMETLKHPAHQELTAGKTMMAK